MTETASLDQVYGEVLESEDLLPMNDLGIQSGYILYESEIFVTTEEPVLKIANVRDYASVYIDDKQVGELTGDNRSLTLSVSEGKHSLKLYAENIGRITYGPEILDNSKGLFGSATLDNEDLKNWKITVLDIKIYPVKDLTFINSDSLSVPCFYKGDFYYSDSSITYLDMSGWGMGEVWINGQYLGAYWERLPQKTIQIDADMLVQGKNEVIVFDLNYKEKRSLNLTKIPLFK